MTMRNDKAFHVQNVEKEHTSMSSARRRAGFQTTMAILVFESGRSSALLPTQLLETRLENIIMNFAR